LDASAQTEHSRPLRGIALVSLAVFTFAFGDVVTKHLTMRYEVPLVIFLRYVINFVILAIAYLPRDGRRVMRTRRTGMVVLRGATLAVASLCAALALQRMPVGETIAIIYLAPFIVALLATPLLGEKLQIASLIAAFAGFCGVLLIARPGSGLDAAGVAYALACAAATVAYHLLSRVLSRTESNSAMLMHTALLGSAVFGALAAFSWPWTLPQGIDIAFMLGLGALAALGHFLFTSSYREAPAALLAPINYLHLVWAAALGYLVFGHVPDWITASGIALIVAAGAGMTLRTALRRG
jgi:drug/metabolite transporter (DMT)-like permease